MSLFYNFQKSLPEYKNRASSVKDDVAKMQTSEFNKTDWIALALKFLKWKRKGVELGETHQ
jgi:hypothetical protein